MVHGGGVSPIALIPAEKQKRVGDISGGVALIESVRADSIPVEFPIALFHPTAIAIVGVSDAGGGDELILGVVSIRCDGGDAGHVSGSVVVVAARLILRR